MLEPRELAVGLISVLLLSPSVVRAEQPTTPLRTPASGQAACLSDAFKNRIEKGLAGYADVTGIPGISIGIVASDSLVHTASVGYANKADHRVASPDTLYNIASVTKVLTATLALSLAEDGIVQLDEPVSNYLPADVRVPMDAAGGRITIRHLLSHTAGLPKDPPNRRNVDTKGGIDPGIWDTYNVGDLYAALPATTLKGNVGEQYNYSNYGYALVGHVLERAAGRPFESLLRQRILTPLGMSDTAIVLNPAQAPRLAAFYWSEDPNRAEAPLHANYGEVAAFIGLSSTVRDLGAFVAAHLQRSSGPDNPIPLAARAVSAKPYAQAYVDPSLRIDIGLGWFHETELEDHSVMLYHTGEVDGHTAGLYLDPSLGVGVVVLQNLGGDVGTRGIERIGPWLLENTARQLRNTTGCGPTTLPR